MNWIESLLKKIESGNRKILIGLLVSVSAAVFAIMLLIGSILERKAEAKDHVFRVVNLTEDTVDPAEWGKNFPRQYDSYKRTVDIERTKHGGSEAFQNWMMIHFFGSYLPVMRSELILEKREDMPICFKIKTKRSE